MVQQQHNAEHAERRLNCRASRRAPNGQDGPRAALSLSLSLFFVFLPPSLPSFFFFLSFFFPLLARLDRDRQHSEIGFAGDACRTAKSANRPVYGLVCGFSPHQVPLDICFSK